MALPYSFRRPGLASLYLVWLLSTPAPAQVAARAGDNVLIVIADDLGVDNIGAYAEGPNPPPTPNIDALARRGVLFRNAWTNPTCSPTRACIQTGRYSSRTGVGAVIVYRPPRPSEPQGVLPLGEITIPELLDARGSGYSHAAIGKWHLGDETVGGLLSPNMAGWSHFAGFFTQGNKYYTWDRTVNGATAKSYTYSTTQMVDDTLAWIDQAQEPWVVHLAFNAPHTPFHEPPSNLHSQSLSGLSVSQTPVPFYKAMIEAMDTEIGRLFAALGPTMARTNVIFMADNGTPWQVAEPPFLPTHAKGTPYEGGVNVPLIVAGPAVQQPGREEPTLVSAVDVFATAVDLCGVEPEIPFRKIDGVSFVPHLRAPGQPPLRQFAFAERFKAPALGPGPNVMAIRDARFKIARHYAGSGQEELFDLTTDPFETVNLLAGPLTPQAAAAYAALLSAYAAIGDESASFERFGSTTCVGSNGTPTLSWSGEATQGSSYTVTLTDGAPQKPVALLVGASRTQWSGLTLPFSLTAIGGGPGCALHTSMDLAVLTATDATGQASASIRLPASRQLIAGTIYHSWLVLDPMAPNNALGVTTSGAVEVVVGR